MSDKENPGQLQATFDEGEICDTQNSDEKQSAKDNDAKNAQASQEAKKDEIDDIELGLFAAQDNETMNASGKQGSQENVAESIIIEEP